MSARSLHVIKSTVLDIFRCDDIFTNLVALGMAFGLSLVSFGDPGGTFSDFEVFETGLRSDDFFGDALGAQAVARHREEGNGSLQGGRG